MGGDGEKLSLSYSICVHHAALSIKFSKIIICLIGAKSVSMVHLVTNPYSFDLNLILTQFFLHSRILKMSQATELPHQLMVKLSQLYQHGLRQPLQN